MIDQDESSVSLTLYHLQIDRKTTNILIICTCFWQFATCLYFVAVGGEKKKMLCRQRDPQSVFSLFSLFAFLCNTSSLPLQHIYLGT